MHFGRITTLLTAAGGTVLQVISLAAGGSSAPPWVQSLGLVGSALNGYGFGGLATWSGEYGQSRSALRDLLVNEDLAKAQARCVQQRLVAYAEKCERIPANRHYGSMVRAFAKETRTWWINEVEQVGRTELNDLRDENAVKQLTSLLVDGDTAMLDSKTWYELFLRATRTMGAEHRLVGPVVMDMAAYVAEHFKEDWFKSLKDDLETGGKAYAAVSLRYFAEILSAVQNGGGKDPRYSELLKEMPRFARELTKAKKALLALTDLPEHLREIVEDSELRIAELIRVESSQTRKSISVSERRILTTFLCMAGLLLIIVLFYGRAFLAGLGDLRDKWAEDAHRNAPPTIIAAPAAASVEAANPLAEQLRTAVKHCDGMIKIGQSHTETHFQYFDKHPRKGVTEEFDPDNVDTDSLDRQYVIDYIGRSVHRIAEVPYSHTGDWFGFYAYYFDVRGNCYAARSRISTEDYVCDATLEISNDSCRIIRFDRLELYDQDFRLIHTDRVLEDACDIELPYVDCDFHQFVDYKPFAKLEQFLDWHNITL